MNGPAAPAPPPPVPEACDDHRGDHPKTPALSEHAPCELSTAAFLAERKLVPSVIITRSGDGQGWRRGRKAIHAFVLVEMRLYEHV